MMAAISKGKCVHMLCLYVYMVGWGGGLLQIQEDIQSAVQLSLEGVHPF